MTTIPPVQPPLDPSPTDPVPRPGPNPIPPTEPSGPDPVPEPAPM